MQRKPIIVLAICIFALTACLSKPAKSTGFAQGTPTTTQSHMEERIITTPTPESGAHPTISSKETDVSSNVTVTPTLLTGVENTDFCDDMLPIIPTEVALGGNLVLHSFENQTETLSLLDMEHLRINQSHIAENFSCISTSPNGKLLSYCYLPENEIYKQLIIDASDGQKYGQVLMEQNWSDNRGFWLDNSQLWFTVALSSNEIAPVVIVNPFTNEIQFMPSDYPGISLYDVGFAVNSTSRLHFIYTSFVYHPTLDLVIYPKEEKDGTYIVLWDRKAEKELAKLPDFYFGHLPIWLPDGESFVTVAKSQESQDVREWFIVSRDGERIQQLTHLGDSYTERSIIFSQDGPYRINDNASISPNGSYLTFGLSLPNEATPSRGGVLIILNLETTELVKTCAWLKSPEHPPVWSPDSRYFVAELLDSENNDSIVGLFDIEQGWIAQIAEDTMPVGWMVAP